jgi:multisubunit Na+/H+ antiporter MnhF subunit
MIALAVAAGLALAGCLFLVRALRGPGPFDRLAATAGLLVSATLFAATAIGADARAFDAALIAATGGAALALAGVKAAWGTPFGAPLIGDGET